MVRLLVAVVAEVDQLSLAAEVRVEDGDPEDGMDTDEARQGSSAVVFDSVTQVVGILLEAYGPELVPFLTDLVSIFADRLDNPRATEAQQLETLSMLALVIQGGGRLAAEQLAPVLGPAAMERVIADPPGASELDYQAADEE